MDVVDFCGFIEKMHDSIQEETIRAEYNSLLPWMYAGFLKFMSFSEYMDSKTGKNIDLRPKEEILAEVEKIRGEINGSV